MTVIYRGLLYELSDDEVVLRGASEEPRRIEIDSLPLPVTRVLRTLRTA